MLLIVWHVNFLKVILRNLCLSICILISVLDSLNVLCQWILPVVKSFSSSPCVDACPMVTSSLSDWASDPR